LAITSKKMYQLFTARKTTRNTVPINEEFNTHRQSRSHVWVSVDQSNAQRQKGNAVRKKEEIRNLATRALFRAIREHWPRRDVTGTRKSGRFRVGSGTRTRPEIFAFSGRFRVPAIDPGKQTFRVYPESNQNFFFQLRAESGAYFFLPVSLTVFRPSYQLSS
jgi:hypothetical protein